MRFKVGDNVYYTDNDGNDYEAEVISIDSTDRSSPYLISIRSTQGDPHRRGLSPGIELRVSGAEIVSESNKRTNTIKDINKLIDSVVNVDEQSAIASDPDQLNSYTQHVYDSMDPAGMTFEINKFKSSNPFVYGLTGEGAFHESR